MAEDDILLRCIEALGAEVAKANAERDEALATVALAQICRWRPIAEADKTITDVQDFPEAGITIKTSDRYWVRDEDGRVYEAAWSEGNYGRDYWWDFEGESPVDPVEFMPHPLDPRWQATRKSKEDE